MPSLHYMLPAMPSFYLLVPLQGGWWDGVVLVSVIQGYMMVGQVRSFYAALAATGAGASCHRAFIFFLLIAAGVLRTPCVLRPTVCRRTHLPRRPAHAFALLPPH